MSNYDKNLQILIDKVDGRINATWDDVCDLIGIDVHPDSLRKAFTVTDYCGYKVAKYLMDKSANELTDDMVAKLQQKKDEEYKERIRLQDARREYAKELRAEARFENLVEILENALCDADFNHLEYASQVAYNPKNTKHKYGVLMLSDWHYGAICDSQWNYYNTNVAKERAITLTKKVQRHILNNHITHLVVECNGDMVEGLINLGCKVASEESVVEQIVNVSKLLAECILSLKPYVQSIKVVTTLGNHGRLTPNKKEQFDERENFEMLIPEFLRLILGNDIPVITSQGMDFVKYNVGGKIICLSHGHHDKVNSAIENMVKVYGEVPDEIHLGHYHHAIDLNESNIHVTVNGSLKGVDDFSLKATRCITKPSQNFIIYDEDRTMIEITVD